MIYKTTIKEHHLDSYGHVNNAMYMQLFEEARWDFMTQNGYGQEEVTTLRIGPVILEATIKYTKELRLNQTISIETIFSSLKKKIGKINQVMFNEMKEECCLAEFKYGLLDLDKRKLVLPSERWLRAIL